MNLSLTDNNVNSREQLLKHLENQKAGTDFYVEGESDKALLFNLVMNGDLKPIMKMFKSTIAPEQEPKKEFSSIGVKVPETNFKIYYSSSYVDR